MLEVVADQFRNVLAAFAQRRQLNGVHVQAVIQVVAEGAGRDHRFQIAVGSGNQTHVGLKHLVAADALKLLILQDAQHFHLCHRRHVADFVEEEGAAVTLLEFADTLAVGPGECALFVSE